MIKNIKYKICKNKFKFILNRNIKKIQTKLTQNLIKKKYKI